MTPTQTLDDIENLLSLMAESEVAIAVNKTVVDWLTSPRVQRITWSNNRSVPGWLFRTDAGTFEEYRGWIEHSGYAAVLLDGAILQISFDFSGPELVGHRLLYFPCPFDLDHSLLMDEDLSLLEIIDLYANPIKANEIRLRSPVRFDYTRGDTNPNHPPSHMTFQWRRVRLPVSAPLSLGHFVHFVFKYFYPDLWSIHQFIREWPVDEILGDSSSLNGTYLSLVAPTGDLTAAAGQF